MQFLTSEGENHCRRLTSYRLGVDFRHVTKECTLYASESQGKALKVYEIKVAILPVNSVDLGGFKSKGKILWSQYRNQISPVVDALALASRLGRKGNGLRPQLPAKIARQNVLRHRVDVDIGDEGDFYINTLNGCNNETK